MKFFRTFVPAALASVAMFGQTPAARPEFEVASVKPAPALSTAERVSVGVHVDGAQVHISSLSLRDYIRIAYRVKMYQVSGPEWLASERFDVDAKLPLGAVREQAPDMLRALLEDRFQLKTHRGSEELPVYALTVAGGGVKMKESPEDPDAGADASKPVEVTAGGGTGGVSFSLAKGSDFTFRDNRIEARKLTMAVFADTLSRFLDRPLVDMTELKGKYDFKIDLTPEDYRVMLIQSALSAGVALPPEALRLLAGATDDSLIGGLRALGLKMDPRKAPLDVVIVDHVLKTPTEN
jgi:uncharacterized protein (TIGR03435 family)